MSAFLFFTFFFLKFILKVFYVVFHLGEGKREGNLVTYILCSMMCYSLTIKYYDSFFFNLPTVGTSANGWTVFFSRC
jgi:hypothetical protein